MNIGTNTLIEVKRRTKIGLNKMKENIKLLK